MSTLVLGGTGLLGYHAAVALLDGGQQVSSLSTGSNAPESWYPAGAVLHRGDVLEMSTEQLTELLIGKDALVYALGPDDRETPRAPAADFFNERLVETSVRVVHAAKTAGLRSAVVFGSYLTYFDRTGLPSV